MSDAVNDAMSIIVPVLQASHAAIIKEAGGIPLPPVLLNPVRKLGGNLSLSLAHKDPMPFSYMQQIAWDISDSNVMCSMVLLVVTLLPKGIVLVVHSNVKGLRIWTKAGQDTLCIEPFEFGIPLSAQAGK